MGVKVWIENAFNIAMVGFIIFNLSRVPALVKHEHPTATNQTTLAEETLLNKTGQLTESGWARKPTKKIDPATFGSVILGIGKLSPLKYRKSDEYVFFNSHFIVWVLARESSFSSNAAVAVYDRKTKSLYERFGLQLGGLANGSSLDDNVHHCPSNSAKFAKDGLTLNLETVTKAEECESILTFPDEQGQEIRLDIRRNLARESVTDVAPVSPDAKHWIHSFRAGAVEASLQVAGGKKQNGLASLSHLRSLQFYKSASLWGTGAGRVDGKPFALHFGVLNFHNSTRTSEDFFVLDGVTHKLDPLQLTYDKLNFMNGFSIASYGSNAQAAEDNVPLERKAEIVFRSTMHKHLGFNYFLLKNSYELVFGELTGWVTDEAGVKYSFEDIPAFIQLNDFKA